MTAKTFSFSHWKKNVLRGEPGHRFRQRYERNKRSRDGSSFGRRAIRFLVALVAIAIGAVLSVIPGPAIPFFIIAGGLLASDWLWLAKVLDAGEVKVRRWAHRVRQVWKRLPRFAHVLLLLLGAALSAATTYGFYRLMH